MPDVLQAAPGAGDYLDQLARFVGLTPEEDIPEAVLARTREILLDSFPVLACGMRTPELVALSDKQVASAAPGKSWVIGKGCTTNRLDAAMLEEHDPQRLDRLASAQARLSAQEFALAGRPMPGQRRPGAAPQTRPPPA